MPIESLQTDILMPAVALVAVIAAVWVKLYVDRIGEMKAKGIDTEDFSGPNNVKNALENINASDNFKNLFEMPMLFFVLCGFVAITGLTSSTLLGLAWAYVALRAAHSFIHTTYNRVMHRFMVYAASSVLLFVMWAMFALQLMAK